VVELAHFSPDLAMPDIDGAPASRPLPLAVCWMIWIAASLGLWGLALRVVSFAL